VRLPSCPPRTFLQADPISSCVCDRRHLRTHNKLPGGGRGRRKASTALANAAIAAVVGNGASTSAAGAALAGPPGRPQGEAGWSSAELGGARSRQTGRGDVDVDEVEEDEDDDDDENEDNDFDEDDDGEGEDEDEDEDM
jgi:hypothetical protein